jgi:hypothetical protein
MGAGNIELTLHFDRRLRGLAGAENSYVAAF